MGSIRYFLNEVCLTFLTFHIISLREMRERGFLNTSGKSNWKVSAPHCHFSVQISAGVFYWHHLFPHAAALTPISFQTKVLFFLQVTMAAIDSRVYFVILLFIHSPTFDQHTTTCSRVKVKLLATHVENCNSASHEVNGVTVRVQKRSPDLSHVVLSLYTTWGHDTLTSLSIH